MPKPATAHCAAFDAALRPVPLVGHKHTKHRARKGPRSAVGPSLPPGQSRAIGIPVFLYVLKVHSPGQRPGWIVKIHHVMLRGDDTGQAGWRITGRWGREE